MVLASALLSGLVPPAVQPPIIAPAAQHQETAVVVASDEAFRAALRDALTPTGMRLITMDDAAPSIWEVSVVGRQIAEREHASCVVWLIATDQGSTIVAYDRDVDRVLIRNVAYSAPLTATKAAAAARTTRTMLRALRITPDLDEALPTAAAARVVRAQLAARPDLEPARHQRFAVSATVAGRVGSAGARGEVDLQGSLSALWRPHSLGVGLHLSTATRVAVQEERFSGRAADDSLALTVHLPVARGSRLHVRGLGGVAVHMVSLDGAIDETSAKMRSFDPALRVGLAADYQLTRILDIGIVFASDALLLRQKYVVDDTAVLTVSRFQVSTGVAMTLSFL
jgi:hypothetical protein